MEELRQYTNALAKHYQDYQVKLPLVAADMYLEGFHDLNKRLIDVCKIDKIALENEWNTVSFNYREALIAHQNVVFILEPSGNIFYTSFNVEELTGYNAESLLQTSIEELQQRELSDKQIAFIVENLQAKTPFEMMITNYHKNETAYICKVNCYPIWDLEGQLKNYILFVKAI
ncbi:PAS domain-containing protein [Zhouia sp. PK063]|uniref:PAS domain-containing protein n=1 Tax=Zhouia sp. PK063 TaxID=3373602 RepID=UPI0037918BAB